MCARSGYGQKIAERTGDESSNLPHHESHRASSYAERSRRLLRPLVRLMSVMRVHPDALTLLG